MTNYLAAKAEKEELSTSLAKGDNDGWTTVSRRTVRGRGSSINDHENSTVGRTAGEGKSFDASLFVNKTPHKYEGTAKHQTSHVKILKRNSNTSSNVIKPTALYHEDGTKRDDHNIPQKTAGILKIPDMRALLVDEGTNRWKEFNAAKEIWPSIDAKEDGNRTMQHGIKSYSSILRTTPQPNIPLLTMDNRVDSHSESAEDEQVGSEAQKKKKKSKKKKKKSCTEEERRTDKPVTIDFGSILDMQQSSFKSNQPEASTTTTNSSRSNATLTTSKAPPKKLLLTTTPLVSALSANKPPSKGKTTVTHMPHNMLDSTAPLVKRGKERETPAKKRPSALKKVILKEREEKKRQRELGEPMLDNMVGQLNELSMADGAHDEEATQVSSGSHDLQQHQQSLEEEAFEQQFNLQAILPSQKPKQLHSRKFREYCDHMLSPEIDNCVINLLSDLHRFQARAYLKDPIKARAKRRYVLGLREVTKHLRLKKIKCVIASPNMERIQSTGGIDEMLMHIVQLCNDYNITMVYALNRRKMGGILRKKVPVSIVGIFSYDGAEQHFKKLVQLVSEKRELYRDKLQLLLHTVPAIPTDSVMQDVEEEGDSPCDDDTPCDDEDEQIDQFFYDDDDSSWDQSMLHTDDIIQGSCDALQGGYYYIPAYYQSPYTHLNIDAPEFIPSWRYS